MTTPELNIIESDKENMGSFPPPTTAQRAIPILIAALVVLADHFSKLFIEILLPLHRSWAPFPDYAHLFSFTHVSNTGAAFGLFPGGSFIFTLIAIVVALVIVVYNYGLPSGNRVLRLALGLQVGGALGNLVDRLRLGHVTDFLDFGPWPVFNLADTSIVGGVVLLGLLMLVEQRQFAAQAQLEQVGDGDGAQSPPLNRLPSQRQNEQAT